MNKTYILVTLWIITLIGIATAETYQVGTAIDLKMRCTVNGAIPSSSAIFNITITYSNGTTFKSNNATTPLGTGLFSYGAVVFPDVGEYYIYEFCIDGTKSYSNTETITVTTTGKENWNTIPIYFWIAAILVFCVGLYQHNELFGFISACLFIVAGIYMMIYGFGIFNDMYTRTLSYVSLGIGLIIAFASVIEMFHEGDSGGGE